MLYFNDLLPICLKCRCRVVKFVWHHSIAWRRKLLLDARILEISYTNRVRPIAHVVSNFVAMETGIVVEFVWHHSARPCRRYFPYKLSYSLFCLKISLPWQQGSSGGNFKRRCSICRHRKLYPTTKNYESVLRTTGFMTVYCIFKFSP